MTGRWDVGQTSGLPVQGDSLCLNSSTGLQSKPEPADRSSAPHTERARLSWRPFRSVLWAINPSIRFRQQGGDVIAQILGHGRHGAVGVDDFKVVALLKLAEGFAHGHLIFQKAVKHVA